MQAAKEPSFKRNAKYKFLKKIWKEELTIDLSWMQINSKQRGKPKDL